MEIAVACAKAAEDKKAQNIKIIEMSEIIPITDYFVLVTAVSARQVEILSGIIRDLIKGMKLGIPSIEGAGAGWWRLVDVGSVVVHIFEEKARDYYDLDGLLADAPVMDINMTQEGSRKRKEA